MQQSPCPCLNKSLSLCAKNNRNHRSTLMSVMEIQADFEANGRRTQYRETTAGLHDSGASMRGALTLEAHATWVARLTATDLQTR